MTSSVSRPGIDVAMADPHPWYRSLRDESPVLRVDDDLWLVSRHADVTAVLRDHRRFSSWFGNDRRGRHVDALPSMDPPDHTGVRRPAAAPLAPRPSRSYEQLVDEVVQRASQRLAASRRRVDVVRTFANVVPNEVMAAVMGVDARSLAAAADRVGPYRWSLFRRAYAEYCGGSGTDPEHPLLASLATAHEAGDLTEDDVVGFLVLLMTAAIETTRDLFSELLLLAATDGAVWTQITDSPDVSAPVADELLRWISPLHAIFRTVSADSDIGGVAVPADARLMMLLGSANRDERVWADGERFVPGRFAGPGPADHVAFGGGAHHCVGATLARLQIAAVVRELPRHVAGLQVDGEVVRRPSVMARGLLTLPVRVTSA